MKKILLILLFLVPIFVAHAQQPPPKTPKDPDINIIPVDKADSLSTPIKMYSVITNPNGIDTLHSKVFYRVEHEPEFPGGIEKLYRYIGKNLRYPSAAKENSIQGKVYITFVVEKDGSLTDFKIVRSLSPETDAEAIRLLKDGPKWNPGIQNGRPVRVSYSMPVDFELAN